MSKILIDRAVVEQALHVATAAGYPVALIAALRASLAKQQEPGFWGRVSARQASRIKHLEATAQQALEFIRTMNQQGWMLADYEDDMERTVAGLEAALAEPVQEPAKPDHESIRWQLCLLAQTEEFSDEVRNQIARGVWLIDQLRTAQPVEEPVYWEVRCTAHPKWMRVDEQQFDEYVANGWEGQRLYTSPPQRPAEPVKQCMAHGECFGGECIYQRPAEPVQDERTGITDLRCAKWLDPECADKGACQSLKFKRSAEPVQEPTKAMIDAAERIDWSDADVRGNIINMWQAMIAAAPQPSQQQEPVALVDIHMESSKDKERLDWLEKAADKQKIELARSILRTGYEIGEWPSMKVTVKSGSLRDAIDAAMKYKKLAKIDNKSIS